MMPDVLIAAFPYLMRGAVQTIWLSAVSIGLATVLGVAGGLLNVYGPRPLRWLMTGYTLAVRGIPVLVLMFLAYYALPNAGVTSSPYVAVAAALAFYGAGFVIEVTRGGILAIPAGQLDAAKSLGLRRPAILWLIVLPQALRFSIPPFLNVVIILVKSTAYASIVGAWELAYAAREVVERALAPFQIFLGVICIYFVLCYPLSVLARRLEARLAER
jgi:polar amino acid transport system permease protein